MSSVDVLPAVKTCCKSGITVGIVYHSTLNPVLVRTWPAVPIEVLTSKRPPEIWVSPVKKLSKMVAILLTSRSVV